MTMANSTIASSSASSSVTTPYNPEGKYTPDELRKIKEASESELTAISEMVQKKFGDKNWVKQNFAEKKITEKIVEVVQGVVAKNSGMINEQIKKNIIKMVDDSFMDVVIAQDVKKLVREEIMSQFKDKYLKTIKKDMVKTIEEVEASSFIKDLHRL